jgi:hypothetical protein
MKITIQHTTYGEIIYEESIWTGKKELTVNGVKAQKTSKKTFIVDGKNAIINGSLYSGDRYHSNRNSTKAEVV